MGLENLPPERVACHQERANASRYLFWRRKMREKKVRGYRSAGLAAEAAKRRGDFGLTGSGQECSPIPISDGFGFRTWDGRVLIPGGELSRNEVREEIWKS